MLTDNLIERFGLYFDGIGLSKTSGRMFGTFMTLTKPISMGELVNALQISKSTASVELKRLQTMGYIEKVLLPNERADFYQLKKDIWVRHLQQKSQMINQLQSIISEIPEEVLGQYANLKEMQEYCVFIEAELTSLTTKYLKRKQTSGSFTQVAKNGERYTLTWKKLPALSLEYFEEMTRLSPLGIAAFSEIELEFISAMPNALDEDPSLLSLKDLSATQLKEAMQARVRKMFCTHPNQLPESWKNAMQPAFYYVITIQEESTPSPAGFITLMGGLKPNQLKITALAIEKNQRKKGLASLLCNALPKFHSQAESLFVSTRPSNKGALAAYKKWGFQEDSSVTPEHFLPGHWIHLTKST